METANIDSDWAQERRVAGAQGRRPLLRSRPAPLVAAELAVWGLATARSRKVHTFS